MTTLAVLSVIFGGLVGLSLGLTGGGGSLFAVPLLVYGLSIPTREAVGISLLTVGFTSLIGFIQRARQRMVEFPTGIVFAVAGMLGAPVGSRIADHLSEQLLLGAFALLMLLIAVRMWTRAEEMSTWVPTTHIDQPGTGPVCHRTQDGKLKLTSPCVAMLCAVGFGTGVLTGLFGVGGGFIIVPALITFVCMDMKRAVATSLLVIALVSVSGVLTHLLSGRDLSLESALPFTVGSLLGLFAGTTLAKQLSGPVLQRVFAVAIMFIAVYVVGKSFA